jgi:hypothetical protein
MATPLYRKGMASIVIRDSKPVDKRKNVEFSPDCSGKPAAQRGLAAKSRILKLRKAAMLML